MTWNEMLGKIREGLGESSAHLRAAGNLVAEVAEEDCIFNDAQIASMIASLTLAVSNLHSAVEHMSIGLDAVVEAMKEASKSNK